MSKENILEAAAQIFRQKGYHASSMQEIAEAVNLQKATLYHHVNSKQEILLELLDRALLLLTERLSVVFQAQLSPDEKLRQAMRGYLAAVTENIDLASVLLLEHRSLEPRLHARHIPNRDRFEALWREVIQDGVRKGLFICDDPSLVTRGLLGVMNWTITWYRPNGPMSIEEISDQFAEIFLFGLTGQKE